MPTGRLTPTRTGLTSTRAMFGACLLASAIPAGVARGEEATRIPFHSRLDMTAFAGYRFGGQFDVPDSTQNADVQNDASFAVSLGLALPHASVYDELDRYEIFYSRQSTDLGDNPSVGRAGVKIEYLQFGASKEFPWGEHARPYLLGALGASHLSLDVPGASDDTRFSLSLALGLRFPVSDHFSLRVEGRGYVTFLSADSSIFCASSGAAACGIHASGSALFQFDVLAGASFAF
jgi:opacity protein-like surface antigen